MNSKGVFTIVTNQEPFETFIFGKFLFFHGIVLIYLSRPEFGR
jgi:hypothetical protein